jgi:hypothetical protein
MIFHEKKAPQDRHRRRLAPSSFWNKLCICIGLSFGCRKIIPSSLSTAHPIHNRTIDAKYSTAVERPTTPDTNGSGQVLRERQAGTEDQMASPKSKPKELPEDSKLFCTD